ncbi:DUF1906 domain-containing protein [Dactylosporangium sp. CA-092794]|uniref:DUF1906 domain-containing protein n=1 Tax=Dactylosporangium sp. CA-092794 TaxID=3239929 RepID=UPI003D8C89D9
MTASAAEAAPAQPGTQTISYLGHRFTVPDSWPVVDLTSDPNTCVRFDRHAVYLGRPGLNQDCPARLMGRSEALLVQPDAAASGGARTVENATAHEFTTSVDGLTVSVTYGQDRAAAQAILASAGLPSTGLAGAASGATPAGKAAATQAATSALVGSDATNYTGYGFDACAAPSSAAMNAWLGSPYRAVGIYFGGGNRSCSQPNLTASWIAAQASAGWHFIPLYLGLQASTQSCPNCTLITSPASQGSSAAIDAVNQAQALGLPAGSTLYYDMEFYGSHSSIALTFESAWTQQLHALGYKSGIYSSLSSSITDLMNNQSSYTMPDVIDFASWPGSGATTYDPAIPSTLWANHQRVHQYSGGHDETYGGYLINIDQDYLDVQVGSGGSTPPPSGTYTVTTFASAPGYASATSTSQTGTLNAGSNYVYCKYWGRQIGSGSSYNHWWLKTDLDTGSPWQNQYISAYYLNNWGSDEALADNGVTIPTCSGGAQPVTQYTVTTFANAPGYASETSTGQTGTLNAGSNYVYCKYWGRQIGSGSSYNHWWLRTDLDTGSPWQNQYVSAYYLSNWGSDEAFADNGVSIPSC